MANTASKTSGNTQTAGPRSPTVNHAVPATTSGIATSSSSGKPSSHAWYLQLQIGEGLRLGQPEADEQMIEDEIWVVAPPGFRPSQWVEMFRDYDSAYDVDPHLVRERSVASGDVLVIEGQILDELHAQADRRMACFWELMNKVAALGLELSCPAQLAHVRSAAWTAVETFCQTRGIPIHARN